MREHQRRRSGARTHERALWGFGEMRRSGVVDFGASNGLEALSSLAGNLEDDAILDGVEVIDDDPKAPSDPGLAAWKAVSGAGG